MSDEAYITRQRARDAEYVEQYGAWMASLSPEEKRSLRLNGLDEPSLPSGPRTSSDPADSFHARCEAEFPDDIDYERPIAPQISQADIIRRVVGELMAQDRPRLALECLALVTGIAYDGSSETAIAARHGVHRATVSNRCVGFAISFNLPYSRAMRTTKARQSYQKARTLHLRSRA